jgi:hypothetical protein
MAGLNITSAINPKKTSKKSRNIKPFIPEYKNNFNDYEYKTQKMNDKNNAT